MRTIKFRGYSKDFTENEWFFGNLIDKGNGSFQILPKDPKIWDLSYDGITVIPESIGQFTGLHDKNGKEIFEGDIVTDGVGKYKIVYDLKLAGYQPYCIFRDDPENYCEVIGSIYENPELLEK